MYVVPYKKIALLFLLIIHIGSLNAAPGPTAPSGSAVAIDRLPISFKSGQYTLQGKLLVPKHIAQTTAKIPAIVFCVGSGAGSTTSSYASFVDSLFTNQLPMDSVAILYFDKRGIGASEGKWHTADFESRAADAKAAADYLQSLPFIDKNRIAIAGHSQGGWITQICVSKYPETFVGGISLAGPTFNVWEQVRNDYTSTLMCKEQLTEEAARQKATKKTKVTFLVATALPVKPQWKQLKVIGKFEPGKYLSNIQRSLLLIFGENDALVSPKYSLAELQKLYPGGIPANIQTATIAGANHSFKLTDLCHEGSTKGIPYAAATKNQIRDWVRINLLK
ncbi:alpha/beta hydrolase family protein [Pontibacter burrus]|uniref:alpha/beta hydrolase family protein n=1 Tax=Pontibacter burrus TaxID=2704466 RepID=UPI00293C0A13|nr:alpha/beta fold hydrolase [Pontibacter burrus]